MERDEPDGVETAESRDAANALSRREAMTLVGGVVGGATTTGAGVIASTQPAFAIGGTAQTGADENGDGFTARDVTIRHPNGKVGDVTLQPALSISWDGLNSAPTDVTFDLRVSDGPTGDLTTAAVRSFPVETDAFDGTESGFVFPTPVSVIAETGWTAAEFEPTGGGPGNSGEARVTTDGIRVTVVATLETADGRSYTDAGTDEFDVSVVDTAPGRGRGESDETETPDDPDETETPDETTEPDETEESDDDGETGETQGPDDSADPDETEEPEETEAPDDPDETEEPEETETSDDPDETEEPEETETSDDPDEDDEGDDGGGNDEDDADED